MAGLAFRRRFPGSTFVFYLAVASLIMPGILVGLGVGLTFQLFGVPTRWFVSGLGAQLTWTLPFGLLIMFAVLSRFNRAFEEAGRDLGASHWQIFWMVVVPILLPGIIGVALFGFTLSYDEFPRTLLTAGAQNTLPHGDLGHDHQRHLAGAVCAGNGHHAGLVRGDHAGARLDRHDSAPARAPDGAGAPAAPAGIRRECALMRAARVELE